MYENIFLFCQPISMKKATFSTVSKCFYAITPNKDILCWFKRTELPIPHQAQRLDGSCSFFTFTSLLNTNLITPDIKKPKLSWIEEGKFTKREVNNALWRLSSYDFYCLIDLFQRMTERLFTIIKT